MTVKASILTIALEDFKLSQAFVVPDNDSVGVCILPGSDHFHRAAKLGEADEVVLRQVDGVAMQTRRARPGLGGAEDSMNGLERGHRRGCTILVSGGERRGHLEVLGVLAHVHDDVPQSLQLLPDARPFGVHPHDGMAGAQHSHTRDV